MINLVISKNDALRLIVTHEGKASFLDNVPYYSVPVYSLYDGNDREQKRLERSHHRYNYYKWPMFHFCVGKTSGKTSVLHVDFFGCMECKITVERDFQFVLWKRC
mgnify:CR=1 FL=1